jgi:hypothetical protein
VVSSRLAELVQPRWLDTELLGSVQLHEQPKRPTTILTVYKSLEILSRYWVNRMLPATNMQKSLAILLQKSLAILLQKLPLKWPP